mmetsp:Transcript_68494/g.189547  ORF Transcript_68494/g.189547 Transcript_68494/m.189547 type:complete len:344 (+) Transcript_68494:2089-3120(+)
MVLHCSVSFRLALHGAPSKLGRSRTRRSRCLCPILPFIWQGLQAVQSERWQSLRFGFCSTQRFVSPRGPRQGSPHSLLVTAMLRCLSQRPVGAGLLHSPQALKLQSMGTQGGVHGCMSGQSLILSWAPWHFAPMEAENRKSGDPETGSRLSALLRIIVPCPQPAPQPLGADQSVQVQNKVSSQWPVQFETSLAVLMSHILPQWFGICSIERCRYLSPWHFEQSPQSDQAPQAQSVQVSTSQGPGLHGPVIVSSASQGTPPFLGSSRTLRLRSRWPPPQDLEQTAQSPHTLSLQSIGSGSLQAPASASPGPGLQGAISLREVLSQCAPLPAGKTLMYRLRSCTP